ncbi:MAG: hypothetical protein RR400_00230, partial [Clostridia bacterium]
QSLLQFIESQISSNPEIAAMLSANPSLKSLISGICLMVANVVVFFVVLLIAKIISWVVYAIIAKVSLKGREAPKIDYQTFDKSAEIIAAPIKQKKYRWAGALIGTCQGFVLVLAFFLPVVGLSKTITDFGTVKVEDGAYAEAVGANNPVFANEQLPNSIQELVSKYVPKVVFDVTSAINHSALGILGSVGDLDKKCFDSVASVKVNNEIVGLKSELDSISKIYDDVIYYVNYDWNKVDFKTFDYDRLNKTIDNVFEFKLLKGIMPELVPYLANKMIVNNDSVNLGEFTKEFKTILSKYLTELSAPSKFSVNIKDDLKAITAIAEVAGKSGIVDQLRQPNVNIEEVLTLAFKRNSTNEKSVYEVAYSNLIKTHFFKAAFLDVANLGVAKLNEAKIFTEQLPLLKTEVANADALQCEFAKAFSSLGGLFNVYDKLTDAQKTDIKNFLSVPEKDFGKLFVADYATALNLMGDLLDSIKGSTNLTCQNDKTLYCNLLDMTFGEEKFANWTQFFDKEILKSSFSFRDEFQYFSRSIDVLKSTNLLNLFFATNVDYNAIIAKLVEKENVAGTYKTNLDLLISPILKSTLVQSVFEPMSTKINNELLKMFADTSVQFNANQIPEILVEMLSYIELLGNEMSKFNVKELVTNFSFEKLIALDNLSNSFDVLGNVLDGVKSNANLKPLYLKLLTKFESNEGFNKYINFTEMKKDAFSCRDELNRLSVVFDKLQKANLISEIAAGTVDIDKIFAKFEKDPLKPDFVPLSINEIFAPIIESDLLKPFVINLFNMLNEKVSVALGMAQGQTIAKLPLNIDIKSQKNEIVEFLEKMLPLTKALVSGGISIDTINLNDLGLALTAMKNNAYDVLGNKNEGAVLGGTYNAFIDYLKLDAVYGADIKKVLDGFANPREVDWINLFNLVTSAKELSESGKVNLKDLNSLIEVAGKNPAINNIVKDKIKTAVNSQDPIVNKFIDGIDFGDQKTSSAVKNIVDIASNLADVGSAGTEAEKQVIIDKVESVITSLDSPENKDLIEGMTDVIGTIANPSVSGAINLPPEKKASVGTMIDNMANASSETKDKLKNLFNLK